MQNQVARKARPPPPAFVAVERMFDRVNPTGAGPGGAGTDRPTGRPGPGPRRPGRGDRGRGDRGDRGRTRNGPALAGGAVGRAGRSAGRDHLDRRAVGAVVVRRVGEVVGDGRAGHVADDEVLVMLDRGRAPVVGVRPARCQNP